LLSEPTIPQIRTTDGRRLKNKKLKTKNKRHILKTEIQNITKGLCPFESPKRFFSKTRGDEGFPLITKGLCPFESPKRFFSKTRGDEGFPLIFKFLVCVFYILFFIFDFIFFNICAYLG